MNLFDKTKLFIKNNMFVLLAILTFVIIYGTSVYFLNKKLTNTQNQLANLQAKEGAQVLDDEIIRNFSKKLDSISDMEELLDNYVSNLDIISRDLDALNAKMRGFNVVQVKTPGFNYQGLPSTSTSKPGIPINSTIECIDNKCQDTFGYLGERQHFKLFEPFNNNLQIPFGDISFDAWKKNPWNFKVLPRTYQVVTIISEQGSELQPIVHNQFMISTNDQNYLLPISKNETVFIEKNKSFRFKPNLFLGVGTGVNINDQSSAEVTPFAEVSLFEYGKDNFNPTWTFVGLSAGYNSVEQSMSVGISPVSYNLGEPLPLVNNLYLSPMLGFSTDQSISILGTLKVKL